MALLAPHPHIDERFLADLTAEDELGVVIRTHIHVEASIIEFVRARVRFPDELPRLTYESRLRLAMALGLKNEYFEALKLLGDIRNSFSHKLEASLSNEKIDELFSKLGPEPKELTLEAYTMTKKQRGEADGPTFNKLPPKDRFIFMAVVLKEYLAAAVNEATTTPK